MEIIVGADILTSGISSEIVLPIFLVHDGKSFPCEQWTDFASILNMWAYDLLKYVKSQSGRFSLYFMDGPYRLDVTKSGDNVFIQCIDAHNNTTKMEIRGTYLKLIEAVRDASYKLGKILYAKGMHQGECESIYKQAVLTGNALRAVGRQGDGSSVLTKPQKGDDIPPNSETNE